MKKEQTRRARHTHKSGRRHLHSTNYTRGAIPSRKADAGVATRCYAETRFYHEQYWGG